MNSALTINQLLGVESEAQPLFFSGAVACDFGVLSDAELATIHGGSLTTFEAATLVLGAGALIVSGAGVLAAAGYATAAVVTGSFGVGLGVGGVVGAMGGGY